MTIIGRGGAKYVDLSVPSWWIICWRPRKIIDFLNWQITVFAIAKLNNCFIIQPLSLFSYFYSGGSKKLCAIYDIPGSYLQVMCWVLGQWKGSEKCTINHFFAHTVGKLAFYHRSKEKKFTTKTAHLYQTINKETPSGVSFSAFHTCRIKSDALWEKIGEPKYWVKVVVYNPKQYKKRPLSFYFCCKSLEELKRPLEKLGGMLLCGFRFTQHFFSALITFLLALYLTKLSWPNYNQDFFYLETNNYIYQVPLIKQ